MTALLYVVSIARQSGADHCSRFHTYLLRQYGIKHHVTEPCTVSQVSRAQKMLGDEFGTASNIKNRVNRQSVLGAITSAQQRLKLYNKVSDSQTSIAARCLVPSSSQLP